MPVAVWARHGSRPGVADGRVRCAALSNAPADDGPTALLVPASPSRWCEVAVMAARPRTNRAHRWRQLGRSRAPPGGTLPAAYHSRLGHPGPAHPNPSPPPSGVGRERARAARARGQARHPIGRAQHSARGSHRDHAGRAAAHLPYRLSSSLSAQSRSALRENRTRLCDARRTFARRGG